VAGASMSVMAEIFTRLASIPRLLTMNPSNFPDGNPKMHFVGLSFHRNLRKLLNVWQNRLSYSGSSALVIVIQAILTQRTSNGTTH
jgi:hypothetical protein